MALEITAEKQTKAAKNRIGAFDVQYNFEYTPGEAPEVIRARGTVEEAKPTFDAVFFPATGNFNITFHNLVSDIDVSIAGAVLADIKALAGI